MGWCSWLLFLMRKNDRLLCKIWPRERLPRTRARLCINSGKAFVEGLMGFRRVARGVPATTRTNEPWNSPAWFPMEATMRHQSRISATVSVATRDLLDRFCESHGLTKNVVVEQALLAFMEACREVPDEAFIPTRLVLQDKAFDRIVDVLDEPPTPTNALRELMLSSATVPTAAVEKIAALAQTPAKAGARLRAAAKRR